MSDFTDHQESETLSSIAALNPHVALHAGDPTNSGEVNEVDAASYDRQQVMEADWTVSGSDPTNLTNDNTIDFGEATESWGDVTHYVIWDGATDTDNALVTGALDDSPHSITSGEQVSIPAGGVSVDLT